MKKADIGVIGLAVMGENLVMNMESKGFTVAVYNRNTDKVKNFVDGRGLLKNIRGAYSLEELVEALEKPRKVMLMVKAGQPVDDFIDALEDKYDYKVVQGARNFSGGQRQRLSIARMLMKRPDIYVFDDSFSALDFKTDAALRRALREVTREAIVITVAQRISSIMDADQILVLDEGKIVGRGTHRELLGTCEVYQEIAKSQLSEEELRS